MDACAQTLSTKFSHTLLSIGIDGWCLCYALVVCNALLVVAGVALEELLLFHAWSSRLG